MISITGTAGSVLRMLRQGMLNLRIVVLTTAMIVFSARLHADPEPAKPHARETAVADGPIGALDWGGDPRSGQPWTLQSLKSYLHDSPATLLAERARAVIAGAKEDVDEGLRITPLAVITIEGVPPTDPRRIASQAAINQLPKLFRMAVCARLAADPLASQCLAVARQGILGDASNPGWLKTYHPTGNPINEERLIELFLAIDWVLPLFQKEDQAFIQRWLGGFVLAGDGFYKALHAGDTRRVNNFNTWRLAIRSIVAKISGHPHLIEANASLLHKQLVDNLIAPSKWTPDPTCSNDKQIKAYVGYDFRQRDALTYHAWDLWGWTTLLLYVPRTISSSDRDVIVQGIEFLRKYYLGNPDPQHIEFVCSTVKYDAQECAKGDKGYCHLPWVPTSANPFLRQARAAFPQIQEWTVASLKQKYSPSVVFRAALMGDAAPDPN